MVMVSMVLSSKKVLVCLPQLPQCLNERPQLSSLQVAKTLLVLGVVAVVGRPRATPALVRVAGPGATSAGTLARTATVILYPPFASQGGEMPARTLTVGEAPQCASIGEAL